MKETSKLLKRIITIVIVIAVSFFAAGIFYWTTPLADLEENFPFAWFGLALLAGLVCGVFSGKNFAITGLMVSAGFGLAVIARVEYDINFVDETLHNLFPIEVFIWTIMAAVPAFAGTFVGSWLKRLSQKDLSSNEENDLR
jgi:hypothetical protein